MARDRHLLIRFLEPKVGWWLIIVPRQHVRGEDEFPPPRGRLDAQGCWRTGKILSL